MACGAKTTECAASASAIPIKEWPQLQHQLLHVKATKTLLCRPLLCRREREVKTAARKKRLLSLEATLIFPAVSFHCFLRCRRCDFCMRQQKNIFDFFVLFDHSLIINLQVLGEFATHCQIAVVWDMTRDRSSVWILEGHWSWRWLRCMHVWDFRKVFRKLVSGHSFSLPSLLTHSEVKRLWSASAAAAVANNGAT